MSTEAKDAANAANAQHSTGPRTEQGKAISSLNALKHGLTSKTVLLPGEDKAEFETFADALRADFNPTTAIEIALSQELIDLQWRLLRVSGLESRILSSDTPDYKSLNNISLHASRMKRQFSATLQEFKQIHHANNINRGAQLDKAVTISRADNILGRPSTLGDYGFDFTLEQFERWTARNKAFRDAKEAISEAESKELDMYDDNDDDDDDDMAA